jgi:SAM-dependent methyltransferase
MDKAGKEYWDRAWGTLPAPDAFDPGGRGCTHYRDREFARLFSDALADLPADGSVLEAGAADSSVLPYFATLGHRVIGVDYSEIGCDRLRGRLGALAGDVICCDIFQPPSEVLGRAALVLSIGLVEHFTDTAGCITALARFVRPGGKLLTIIPNMQGAVGLLQRIVAPSVYKVHVPLSLGDLREAHEKAGVKVARSEYVMATNFGVVNCNEPGGGALGRTLRWIVVRGFGRLSCAINVLDEHLCRLPRHKSLAPYCVVVASVE